MSGKIFLLSVCAVMSLVGIAQADVFVEGIGNVSESTARLIYAARAMNEGRGVQAEKPSPQKEAPVLKKVEEVKTVEVKVSKAAATAVKKTPQGVTRQKVVKPLTDIHEADHEVFGYAGYAYSLDSKTQSGWLSAKNTKWWGLKHYPLNLGAGLSLDSSIGKTGSGYSWGYIEPGVNVDAYTFGEDNDFLTRLNFAYRVPLNSNNSQGFVPGIELQATHAFSNRLSLIAQVQAKYFRNDSHGGAALLLEYLFSPEFRIKGGLVADLGIGGGNYRMFGIGPNASVEIDNRYVLGMNLLFFPSPNGLTFGPYVGLKYTKYLDDFDKQKRDASVTKLESGEVSKPLPEASDVYMRGKSDGSQSTLSWDSQDDDKKDLTLAQTLQQTGGSEK